MPAESTDQFERGMVAELPMLRRYAASLTRNADDAADLVQDTVVRALRYRHRFDGANMGGWLLTLARNLFLDGKRKIDRLVPDPEGLHASTLPARDNPEASLAAKDDIALLRFLPRHQKVLMVEIADGLTYEEAAAKHGMREGTVKSAVHRGRTRLKELAGAA